MSQILPRAVARLPSEIYGMSHWLQLTTESFWENWSQWFRWMGLITGYYLHGWHLLIVSGESGVCPWQWYYYTDQTNSITSHPASLASISRGEPSLSWRQTVSRVLAGLERGVTQYKECYQSQYSLPLLPPSQSGENLSPGHNEVSSQYQHYRHSLPGCHTTSMARNNNSSLFTLHCHNVWT